MAEKQYDFTHLPKRQGNSIKWCVLKEKELPMWIAEMDFKIAPEIMASMEEKLKVAAFGYESVPAEYYKAVADWEEIEHRARPKEDWCVFASGVVPAIYFCHGPAVHQPWRPNFGPGARLQHVLLCH